MSCVDEMLPSASASDVALTLRGIWGPAVISLDVIGHSRSKLKPLFALCMVLRRWRGMRGICVGQYLAPPRLLAALAAGALLVGCTRPAPPQAPCDNALDCTLTESCRAGVCTPMEREERG